MLSEKQPEITQEAEALTTTEVSLDEYMEKYAQYGYEWVEGKVIKLTPIGLRHEKIRDYIRLLLQTYFAFKNIGDVLGEPFVMRLPEFPERRREPDLIVILNSNPNELKETYMDGPADICVEIVSPGSVSIDHGDKFEEYAKGGVREYWIVDPLRNECRFYLLDDKGIYKPQAKSEAVYNTPQLPGLFIDTDVFWQDKMPNPVEVVEIVKAMLKEKED